jgi:DNA-binding IscR family transcriptional regulator
LIKGGKGRSGGYVIAKNYDSIFLSDILAATGEPEIFNSCIFGFRDCLLSKSCMIHDKWAEARENIINVLETTNLSHLKSRIPHKIIKKSNKIKIK